MNELDYQPNSHRYKEAQKDETVPKKKVEKVVKGKVKTKKNGIRKLTDVFIAEDIGNVKSYVVQDVLIPAAKKAISDIVRDGIDMILYGESGGRRRSSSGASSYVSYRNYSDRRENDRFNNNSRNRAGYSYDDIILETRGEAEEVLSQLDGLIETYGEASIADLNDLIGKTGVYTDNNYGWTNLRNAEPVRTRDGYMLKLPRAIPLTRK